MLTANLNLKRKTLISAISFLLTFSAEASDSSLTCDNSRTLIHSFGSAQIEQAKSTFTLITWNAHKLKDPDYIKDLSELSKNTDFFAIQEAMHSINFEQLFLNYLPFNFTFYKSFCTGSKQATGVMNASRYPLKNPVNLVSVNREPITGTPKVSGYSAVEVPNLGTVHVINTHGLNFNFGLKFKNQMEQVAAFIKKLEGPVVWTGDFNTWAPERMDVLLRIIKPLGLNYHAPKKDKRTLKLDHILSRGLNLESIEILTNYKSSDHYPIKAVFSVPQPQSDNSENLPTH